MSMTFEADTTAFDEGLVTKEWILQRVTQEEIFQRFLGVPIQTRTLFRSPLRKDKNPTCSFKYFYGKLRFKDWAQTGMTKDCFDIVMEINRCSFGDALLIIARAFDLANVQPKHKPYRPQARQAYENEKSKGNKSIIGVETRDFTQVDVDYLKPFGITRDLCERYRVYSLNRVWLNYRLMHTSTHGDPMLGYFLGLDEQQNQKWKVYFYKRTGRMRFMCNTNRIQGLVQLPESASLLVLTKSLKDVMVLDSFGVPAIAMQSETAMPYDYIVDSLRERFRNIVSLYDFDYAGIRTASKLKKEFGIRPFFLTDGRFDTRNFGAKDISDFIRDNGRDTTAMVLREAMTSLPPDARVQLT